MSSWLTDKQIDNLRSEKTKIGKNCNIARSAYIDTHSEVEIGDSVTLTGQSAILCHDGSGRVTKQPFKYQKTTIGNNVHLNYRALVLMGVTIGDNVVIGAGSIVTKDIPSNCMVAGVPAMVKKTLKQFKKDWDKKKSLKTDPEECYDKFYSKGGWGDKRNWEWRRDMAKKCIFPALSKKILDIGCGMGQDAFLLAEYGHDVTGIDISLEGIKYGRKHYPKVKFICNDLAKQEFKKEEFDVIFARGMSWYHYGLLGVNKNGVNVPKETKRLFKFLKKGGIFTLGIATDFSGTKRHNDSTLNNRLEDYTKLFSQFGKIVSITDWDGKVIKTQEDTDGAKNIFITTKK